MRMLLYAISILFVACCVNGLAFSTPPPSLVGNFSGTVHVKAGGCYEPQFHYYQTMCTDNVVDQPGWISINANGTIAKRFSGVPIHV